MQRFTDGLFALEDKGFADFQAKLIPTVSRENIIGVRTPQLRAYAKEAARMPEAELFLLALPHRYLEENNLHALLLNQMKELPALFAALDRFLPYVDNWATCDLLSPAIFKKHLDETYEKIEQWLNSPHEYAVRFGVDMLLQFYLDDAFRPETNERLARIPAGTYYIDMAVAWYYSFALIKQYDATLPLFEAKTLNPWVHNKSIQKAVESYRVSAQRKEYLKTLRIPRAAKAGYSPAR